MHEPFENLESSYTLEIQMDEFFGLRHVGNGICRCVRSCVFAKPNVV